MFRTLNVGAELEKVARGQKTKIGVENLAALVLQMGIGERRELRKRKREDVRFLETLYRLKDERA